MDINQYTALRDRKELSIETRNPKQFPIKFSRNQKMKEALVIILIMVFIHTELKTTKHRSALFIRVLYAIVVVKLVILAMLPEKEIIGKLI